MADEPFIGGESRPDLTVDMNAKVGDMTVRQLSDILGSSAAPKLKQVFKEGIKDFKEIEKFQKEQIKDGIKDGIKDHKDGKDVPDHKNSKDHKDTTDSKANKDHKESVDTKAHKDNKEHKDVKDHKEVHKEHFKEKDQIVEKNQIVDQNKSLVVDVGKSPKEQVENGPVIVNPGDPVFNSAQGIDQLIQRITGLEQQVATLQGGGG